MAKYRVAVLGTTNKSILIDDALGPQLAALTARVDALEDAGGARAHRSLTGLTQGDDHPQYTMWQASETITGPWTFNANTRWLDSREVQFGTDGDMVMLHNGTNGSIYNATGPLEITSDDGFDMASGSGAVNITGATAVSIESATTDVNVTAADQINLNPGTDVMINGVTLTEFIEDAVGIGLVVDTASIDWVYNDVAGTLEANVIPEFIEDTVGAMLTDTASVDLVYTDASGQISATVLPAGVNHNALANLTTGDPHTQYPLAAGAESITGAWVFDNATGLRVIDTSGVSLPFAESPDLIVERSVKIIRTNAPNLVGVAFGSTGSLTAPAALSSGDFLFNFKGRGYDGTAFSNDRGEIRLIATEAWTNTANGTRWDFLTTPNGSTTEIGVFRVLNGTAVQLLLDNQELQIGASQDLRLYHNGTDSYIENDSGALVFLCGSSGVGIMKPTGATQWRGGAQYIGFDAAGFDNQLGVELGVNAGAPTVQAYDRNLNVVGTLNLNPLGGAVTTPASQTSTAGFRVPHGSAPSSPVDGDIWTTTAGLFVRINGATVGPLS